MATETHDDAAPGGEVRFTGGCLAPQSLIVRFRPEGEQMAVSWEDDRSLGGDGPGTGFGRVSPARYRSLAEQLRSLLDAPRVPPTGSTSACAVSVNLRLPDGVVNGGASEMTEGPPPMPLVDAIDAFVAELRADPGTIELDAAPLAVPRARLGWMPVLLALLLAAALAVFLYSLSS